MGQKAPFIGPRPFTEAETGIFFGREDELAALSAQVVSSQIVLLYAPSGCGKSSLIGAGLIPAMRKKGLTVVQERLNVPASGDRPVDVDELCAAIRDSARPSPDGRPSLLILDQFEQVLAAATYAQLGDVAGTVYQVTADNPLARIVISFREEYLARIDALFGEVSDVSTGRYYLDRLSRDGALEAFERSLETVGYQVEKEAGDLFLEQIAPPTRQARSEAGFEPLYLQLLGSQLWSAVAGRSATEVLPDSSGAPVVRPVVTVADIDSLIDFDQAIEIFYNSRIGQACRSHRVTQKAMRDWIDRELVTSDETRSMVRREPDETEGIPTAALDALVEFGLLRAEPRGDNVWLELAHDQLVERVREFNRVWWNDQVHTQLLDRGERFDIARRASALDVTQWFVGRSTFWGFAMTARETGINISRRYVYWLPFGKKGSPGKVDRLSLRAVAVGGTVFNSLVFVYRSATRPPAASTALLIVEGLDAPMAKRRLRATALNLGWADHILSAADFTAMIGWGTILSQVVTRPAVGAPPSGTRRRVYTGALLGADAGLCALRWAVRNGLIESCLSDDEQLTEHQDGRWAGARRGEAADVRHATNLEEVAAWSKDRPVLLMLDWRGGVDGAREFERYRDRQVPLFEDALNARGAIVAWCCRDEVRRRGWRQIISGLGYPGLGQRTHYVIERGHVVAWRRMTGFEPPERPELAPDIAQSAGVAPPYLQQMEKRFTEVMTSLIVSSEAVPTQWRDWWDNYFKSVLGRRRGET
jgi:hypothetical protein